MLAVADRTTVPTLRVGGFYQAEWMLLAKVKRHREFDRSRPASPSNPHGHVYTSAQLAEMRQSIRANGILEPLGLEYDPVTRMGLLGEGNHRLWLAEEAGHLIVPVVGIGVTTAWLARRVTDRHLVPGEPQLLPEPGHGYFPSTFCPSEVCPPDYFPEVCEG